MVLLAGVSIRTSVKGEHWLHACAGETSTLLMTHSSFAKPGLYTASSAQTPDTTHTSAANDVYLQSLEG